MESNLDNRDAIAALAALAQESRLAAFRLLVQAGPDGMAASRIAETLGMPASSLSFHLKMNQRIVVRNNILDRQPGRTVAKIERQR